MSQLPVTALLKAIPASRHTSGQTIVWQADVPSDYHHAPTPPELRQGQQDDLNARKPWLNNPAMLDDIVPESERHGHNEDGIPRKLAWLAKNGYTVVSNIRPIYVNASLNRTYLKTALVQRDSLSECNSTSNLPQRTAPTPR